MSTPPEIIYNFSHTRSDPRAGKPTPPTRQDIEWLFTVSTTLMAAKLVADGAWRCVRAGDRGDIGSNISWSNVERALINLREADVWSFDAVLDTPDEEMHVLIRPSGYYITKTRKLKEFARFILENHGGDLGRLFALPIDEMREQLLSVWGIGDETADDIILYGSKKPSVRDRCLHEAVVWRGWAGKLRGRVTRTIKNFPPISPA